LIAGTCCCRTYPATNFRGSAPTGGIVVASINSNNASVIDSVSRKRIDAFPAGIEPEVVTRSPQPAYLANKNKSAATIIDGSYRDIKRHEAGLEPYTVLLLNERWVTVSRDRVSPAWR
jgi:hypothetical protein